MIRAYKVTNHKNGSVLLPHNSKFYRTYSKDIPVDMGFVFTGKQIAIDSYRSLPGKVIWECMCSWVELIREVSTDLSSGNLINFWSANKKYTHGHIFEVPLYIGFDIVLVRRIDK